ncbi:unnamed protein product [Rhizoctonia solani]|uniref:HTH CENPB-type domain-containing protein n=1 Tax=Rhizoctonia solani TaxID=456999 RepID=A0A8H2WU84_9AGAM|nr:unnamed protein product [Rhizoctonia solani]
MPPKAASSPKYTEKALQLAIADVESGEYTYKDAAERRQVPKTTIWNRMHGRQDRHTAHEHEQALSPAEEFEIVLWCHQIEQQYLPLRLVHLIACAEMIWNNKNGTTGKPLGVHWYEGFMEHHPDLTFTTNKQISERRVMAKNPAYIMEFYVLLSNILKKYKIPPSRIFNMDEKGFRVGEMGSEKPLDRVIFRVLQQFYGQAVEKKAKDFLTVNKRNFAEVLNEARERTYTHNRILSAFQATGIVPLDPYRSTVMQEFRARIIEEHRGLQFPLGSEISTLLNPQHIRQILLEDCQKVLDNVNASASELRGALTKALAIVEGAEAQALLSEAEVQKLRNAARERAGSRARRGRVGRARVYTQDKIEELRKQEVSRGQRASIKGRTRGHGRGRGRGLKATSSRGRPETPTSVSDESEEESKGEEKSSGVK